MRKKEKAKYRVTFERLSGNRVFAVVRRYDPETGHWRLVGTSQSYGGARGALRASHEGKNIAVTDHWRQGGKSDMIEIEEAEL